MTGEIGSVVPSFSEEVVKVLFLIESLFPFLLGECFKAEIFYKRSVKQKTLDSVDLFLDASPFPKLNAIFAVHSQEFE